MKLLCLLISSLFLLIFAENKNNTAVVKFNPKKNEAPVCQDQEFECYLYAGACKAVSTQKLMHSSCMYTCGSCVDHKNGFAFPKKYSMFFSSPQFKYYSNNYYSNGYNGYCCGCYGGGFVGFAGYPGFGGFGLNGFGLLLNPIEGFLGGLGLAIGSGLANLGALLSHGALGSYGYGFGNNYYCIDYLPSCYLYISYCYSPLSYYYSCMARYCAVTCGLCTAGAIGPGLIANYNPALYPVYNQGGVGYQVPTYNQGGYYYPYQQQQPYYGQQQPYYYPQEQPYYGQQQQPYYGQQQQQPYYPNNGYQQEGYGNQQQQGYGNQQTYGKR